MYVRMELNNSWFWRRLEVHVEVWVGQMVGANVQAKQWVGQQLLLQRATGRNMGEADGDNW